MKIINIVNAGFGASESQMGAFRGTSGFSEDLTVGGVVSRGIQVFLGVLGIVFLVLMIFAGFKWMIANGNEERVKEAKQTLISAVIGLIIIILAYAITYFVFKNLPWGGGGNLQTTP